VFILPHEANTAGAILSLAKENWLKWSHAAT